MEARLVHAFVYGLIIGFVLGVIVWSVFEWKYKRDTKKNQLMDRKRHQLMSTQQNIAGRIKNALEACLSANLQWGHRLLVDGEMMYDFVSAIMVFDTGVNPNRIITKITVSCDFKLDTVRVVTSLPLNSQVTALGPNDLELTTLIVGQLDLIQKWCPTI